MNIVTRWLNRLKLIKAFWRLKVQKGFLLFLNLYSTQQNGLYQEMLFTFINRQNYKPNEKCLPCGTPRINAIANKMRILLHPKREPYPLDLLPIQHLGPPERPLYRHNS